MRLLVTGSQVPDLPAFKRLLLVAEDVAFIDRPSVTRHRAEGRSPNASLVADGKPLWMGRLSLVVVTAVLSIERRLECLGRI